MKTKLSHLVSAILEILRKIKIKTLRLSQKHQQSHKVTKKMK